MSSKINVYDSFGDYRVDADRLEDTSMPLYSAQSSLDRLPVPSLEETCKRFLRTAVPLAKSSEETASLQQAVDAFSQHSQQLQKRLLQRQKENPESSWLQHWWNVLGYLKIRDPIVVHVSYFFRCDDDLKLNKLLQSRQLLQKQGYEACVARSAAVLPAAVQYARTIRSNQTEPATLGKGNNIATLCSTQYKYMFHACRIPQRDHDAYRLYFPDETKDPPSVVIACRGQFFSVPHSAAGDVYQSYTQQQWRIILQTIVDQTKDTQSLPPSVGWLTGMNRNDWAQVRDVLLNQGGQLMQKALKSLECSMFMLCMDVDEEIDTDRDRALQFWVGRSDRTPSEYHNRWYDKSAAIIVTKNGMLGFQGEHSMLDGMPFVDFCDAMVAKGTVKDDCFDNNSESIQQDRLPRVTNIFQEAFKALNPQAKSAIDNCLVKAKNDLTLLIGDYEWDVQHYQEYGSDFMKQARCSPDAYTQMAMQLASYRMFGRPLATYESTQVRRFLHGRTETTRTVSPESLAFCEAMSKNEEDTEELRAHRYQLLQEACSSHVVYIRDALQGQGVDRHFFGLNMSIQDGEAKPDLFSHPLFESSKHFRLSTSSLPNMAVGFGPVVADGLGVGYEAKPTSCIFHITARKEYGWTSQFRDHLEEALKDMRTICDLEQFDPPRSRL